MFNSYLLLNLQINKKVLIYKNFTECDKSQTSIVLGQDAEVSDRCLPDCKQVIKLPKNEDTIARFNESTLAFLFVKISTQIGKKCVILDFCRHVCDQFHQHFTITFHSNFLAPNMYKPKM